jgi:hypothetical protein
MKRVAIKLLVFILLGAIVNVAVAWMAVSIARPMPLGGMFVGLPLENSDEFDDRAAILISLGWKPTPSDEHTVYTLNWTNLSVFGFDRGLWIEDAQRRPTSHASGKIFVQRRMAAILFVSGWPSRSMCGAIWNSALFDEIPVTCPSWVSSNCIVLDDQRGWSDRALPLGPLWPGFAINTIFYAAVLWIIFTIPGSVKRLRRRAKGWCIHCGYDLRGQTTSVNEERRCPECGRAIMARNVVHGAAAPPAPENMATPAEKP